MKYKKYIMFAWAEYEARGGIYDIKDSFDSFEEAKKKVLELKDGSQLYSFEGHIINSDTWEIVFEW